MSISTIFYLYLVLCGTTEYIPNDSFLLVDNQYKYNTSSKRLGVTNIIVRDSEVSLAYNIASSPNHLVDPNRCKYQQDQYPTSNYEEKMKRTMHSWLPRQNKHVLIDLLSKKWGKNGRICNKLQEKKNYYSHKLYRWGIKKVSIFSLSKECHIGIFLFH